MSAKAESCLGFSLHHEKLDYSCKPFSSHHFPTLNVDTIQSFFSNHFFFPFWLIVTFCIIEVIMVHCCPAPHNIWSSFYYSAPPYVFLGQSITCEWLYAKCLFKTIDILAIIVHLLDERDKMVLICRFLWFVFSF